MICLQLQSKTQTDTRRDGNLCRIVAVDSAATVSATATGYKIADTNISTSISNNTWSARAGGFAGDVSRWMDHMFVMIVRPRV